MLPPSASILLVRYFQTVSKIHLLMLSVDLKHLRITSQQCGYEALLNSVTYPQKKPIPLLLPEPNYLATCDIFDDMVNEATAVNVSSF